MSNPEEEFRVADDRDGGSEIITFMGTTTIKPEHQEAYVGPDEGDRRDDPRS
jgi:hypothetical protein